MKMPTWFWVGLSCWLVIGLPAFIIGQGFAGSFSLLPDPPPYFQYPYEDRSFWANATWLLAVAVVYAPLIFVGLLVFQRLRTRKKPNA